MEKSKELTDHNGDYGLFDSVMLSGVSSIGKQFVEELNGQLAYILIFITISFELF